MILLMKDVIYKSSFKYLEQKRGISYNIYSPGGDLINLIKDWIVITKYNRESHSLTLTEPIGILYQHFILPMPNGC